MLNIDVVVSGGIAPIPVKVYIDNLINDHDIHFSRPGSFSEVYVLPPGQYSILIGGMNPEGGFTDITISGDFIEGPSPEGHYRRDSHTYAVFFYVVIN